MRLILALLLFTIAANAVPPAGDYVVVLNDQESPRMVARDHGIGPKKMWTNALHGFHATLTTNHLAKLERDTRVTVIETNLSAAVCTQTLPFGIRRIGCLSNALWLASSVSAINADVAVLDTGIDLTHPDLNVYQHISFADTGDGTDNFGHGTHCAGIIGALNNSSGVVGVAPGCRLWAVKVMDDSGNGMMSSIISGVDYVTQHASEIEVASMSLAGLGLAESLRLAISNSVARGVIYVVAAGNSASDLAGGDWIYGTGDEFFPAWFPEVCTVSALADSDGLPGGYGQNLYINSSWPAVPDDTIAPFSNFSRSVPYGCTVFSPGAKIDVAAPGVNIWSTYKGASYTSMSGTSMAAPHVAGAMALYCAAYGKPTTATGVANARQWMVDHADPQGTWGMNPPNPYPNNDPCPEGLLSVLQIGQSWSQTGSRPVVTITSPANQAVVLSSAAITFSATALDAEDGNVAANLVWNSNLSGQIGTGSTFTRSMASGAHQISARVTDSNGNLGGSAIAIIVQSASNMPPVVTITSPVNGAVVAPGLVTFTGTARDAEDGVISATIHWYLGSSSLGIGASVAVTFPAGKFTVSAVSTDSGLMSATNAVTITVDSGAPTPPPATNYPPIVTISAPLGGASYPLGTTITFVGNATDREDGSLTTSMVWTTETGFVLGTGSTVSTNGLTAGSHTVTASVIDSLGLTGVARVTFTVVAPSSPLSVTATASPTVVVNKQKVLLSATVTAGGVAESGASVSFSIRGANGRVINKTGLLTGSTGTASYYQQVMRSQLGAGIATVTVNANATGHTPAQGTTTFTVR